MNRAIWPLVEGTEPGQESFLRFPGNVAADIEGAIAISDTGHDRVVFGHMLGNAIEVREVIGRGEPGFVDGSFEEAAFREPQGMALSGDMLIVADRGNHAIRMIDLEAGRVATMAGTGEAGRIVEGDPLETTLRSPWDVLLSQYDLYIAMAGSHEIWRIDLKEGELVRHVGTGSGRIDEESAEAITARPMCLASDESRLYFADAALACIRAVPFEPGAEVETLVEEGLFEPGEAHGGTGEARFREAVGIAWGQGNHRLWVADTHGNELRTLEPESRRLETVEPFEETLAEPTGIGSAGHLVFVADTNNHRIVRVDQIDKRVVELEVHGA